MSRLVSVSCAILIASTPAIVGGEPASVSDGDLLKGFVHPPVVFNPGPEYGPDKRNYQGIPGIERAPDGRLWAVWYAGKVWEDQYNYVLAASSGDDGSTWSEPQLVIDPDGDGPHRNSDPCLWLDPTGKLWIFWWLAGDGLSATMAITCEDPDSETPHWSELRALFPGVMLNKPTVLENGDWLMPAAMWHRDQGARVMVSRDQGRTFSLLGAANIPSERRNCDEHMIVERKDGSLMMLVRTAHYGIGRSLSTDGGCTWTEVADYLKQTTARFFIRRLSSGNLLLVKHGAINERAGRSHLTAYLSEDDGETWKGGLMIDERRSVSYPDGTQAPDGTIYVVYDWERGRDKHILMATFKEADVINGSFSLNSRQRVLINFATGKNPRIAAMAAKRASARKLSDNSDAAQLITAPRPELRVVNGEIRPLQADTLLFNDRRYRLASVPAELKSSQFAHASIDTGVTVKCTKEGVVYVLTPTPSRNRDSVEAEARSQGFVKAAVPEFVIFGGGAANACTVYQKVVAAGETITFKKWGVVVF